MTSEKPKMKQIVIGWVISLILVALIVGIWFYGYYSKKSTDNLPTLSMTCERSNEELEDLLKGYRRVQLITVWDDPVIEEEDHDQWISEHGEILDIYYDADQKVISVSPRKSE